MEHQRRVVIVAPTIRIAENFWRVTEGLYFVRPILSNFDDLERRLQGVRNTIFFLLPCGQELPWILDKYRRPGNDFIIISDWRI